MAKQPQILWVCPTEVRLEARRRDLDYSTNIHFVVPHRALMGRVFDVIILDGEFDDGGSIITRERYKHWREVLPTKLKPDGKIIDLGNS